MSYTPTTWQAGDTVTSAKLNKLEQGIASTILFVHETCTTETIDEIDSEIYTLDKTWAEIYTAALAIIIKSDTSKALVEEVDAIEFGIITENSNYQADSENDYPKYIASSYR